MLNSFNQTGWYRPIPYPLAKGTFQKDCPMTFFSKHNIGAGRVRLVHLSTVLMIVSLLTVIMNTSAFAADKKTIFLPLKINAPKDNQELSLQVDAALREALSGKGFEMLSRAEAEKLVSYAGNWPPAGADLQKIAQNTSASHVAVGSLTSLGKQYSVDIKLFDALSPINPTFYFREVKSSEQLKDNLDSIIGDIAAYSNRDFQIASISPSGNNLIDSGAILRKISSKPGSPYNQALLKEDLKAIFSMGYFNDVQVEAADSPQGKKVVFKVVEKPVINSLTFTGLKELKEEDVKKAADIREHYVLNPSKIGEGADKIKELYKSKGFYNTEVKADIAFPNDQGATVTYAISEGEKIYIKEIQFEGNKTFSAKVLRSEIETNEKGFFSWLTASGLLEMEKVKRDTDKIVAYYRNNGFLDAKVGEPVIKQEKSWLYVLFNVEEGSRYKVGTIDIAGDLIVDKQKLLDLLTIRKEEYMSSKIVRDNMMAINDLYAEHGYAFSDINPNLQKSASGNRADITFQVKKGDLVYINRITIKGNTRTRDNVIRRELKVAEGGIFNSKALRESSQNLQRLQYFEQVNITPEPAADPGRMNIIVEIKERSTGSFSIGAGYSSVDQLILMGQISENNFLGRGDKLQLTANVGGTSNRYNLSYTNPHVNDSPLSWGADLFKTHRELDDYTKDSTGGGVRLGYPIFEKWKIYGNYSYTDTELTDVSDNASYIIRHSIDLPVTSSVKTSLVRDNRNKMYGATEGSRNSVSVEYAGGPFGGDGQFTKVEGSTSWFFPLFLGTTFHFEASAGQVFENESDKLPVYERFYLGGMNSIRGFKYGKVSPIDEATGDRIGGDKMWFSNLEFIFPLVESQGIQGLVFYDIGQVLNDDQDWTLNDYVHSTGLGIRWLSPLGPLSVVWGVNLDPRSDEDHSVWDFSVGGVF